ncbi:MAG: hypothetical protein Q9219_003288 [cf. Caloplaca sp. 3 TL-2023]
MSSQPQPSPQQPPHPTQLSPLPPITRHITTHDPHTAKATFHSSAPSGSGWSTLTPSLAFNLIYTTSTPTPSLTSNHDLTAHSALLSSNTLGLVNPTGSVCRVVDFGPSTGEEHSKPVMHRTQSLDYGIVVSGEVECVLDGGEVRRMGVGDVCVQRGTMHAWRNVSGTEWARMVFVLLGCEKVVLEGGKELGAEMGEVPEGIRGVLEGRLGEGGGEGGK